MTGITKDYHSHTHKDTVYKRGVSINKNERCNARIYAFINVVPAFSIALFVRDCSVGIPIVPLLLSEERQCCRMFTAHSPIRFYQNGIVG